MSQAPPISGHALRERFLRFFEAKGHPRVSSDGLVPHDDPTVLFTSAGMNQFKPYFLGKREGLSRATSCQKCLRIGDLDHIRQLKGHHTFFEMLGNFSFGDYFKREAIEWGWEFLTGTLDYAGRKRSAQPELCLQLSPADLWVSVYTEDRDAADVWHKHMGVPTEKIRPLGAQDNFWPSNAPADGPNGPCGPCSEIYVHRDGRDLEIWNLVFTQFDRQEGGTLIPFPKPNIDTGMGLERLTQVVQGATYDYETDLFAPIVHALMAHFHVGVEALRDPQQDLGSLYTMVDHLRASVFLLGDHVLPSNEERGYIVRMLIRRAHWHGGRLLQDRGSRAHLTPFLRDAAVSVIDAYRQPYPQLEEQRAFILDALQAEEERFAETLEVGNDRIAQELHRLKARKAQVVPG